MRAVVLAVTLLLVTGLAVTGVALTASSSGYRIDVVLPSAVGIVAGTPVRIAGLDAGAVSAITARDNQGVATLDIDDAHAPLHAGTVVRVEWRSVLGEHYLQVEPGPSANPALPGGALIPAGSAQVTVEDLLETLDPATREHLAATVRELRATLEGREADLDATLRTAAPSVQALGAVLDAVGQDGPAIRELVGNARGVVTVLAARRAALAGTITDLTVATEAVAVQQRQLTDGLAELPSTLDSVRGALDRVPQAGDAAVALLTDLRPAAARLPSVAGNLSPVLADLRPTLAELGPTLAATATLLDYTPALLDGAEATLPALTQAVSALVPAVGYLRPYTPEVMGLLSNWGNFFSAYDGSGRVGRALFTYGQTALNNQPPAVPLGSTVDDEPLPGSTGGQPWVDANGSGPR